MPTFVGTAGHDIIIGTDDADVIHGGAGNDVLDGRGGNDIVNGDDGDDVIYGGSGPSTYNGGAGFDTLSYENWLGGGVEVDLRPPSGFATAVTGAGTSLVTSQIVFFERIVGSRFGDRLTAYGSFPTTLEGGDGDDYLIGGGSSTTFIGGRGADIIQGGSGNDLILAEGNDDISGGGGYDTVRLAGRYADYIFSTEVDGIGTEFTIIYAANERIRVRDVDRFEFADTTITGPLSVTPRILGTNAADRLVGTGGNDLITGAAGDDFLIGGGGTDILEGGLGIDTAGYSGLSRSYARASEAGMPVTVTGGPEGGSHRLNSIERLSFLDGSVVFGTSSTAAQVFRLYHSAFGTLPNQSDLSDWVGRLDAGLSLARVAEAFAAAPSFVARFAALSNEAFVQAMYYASFQRAGDPGGVVFWTARLSVSSQASILLAFSESAEHQRLLAPATDAGVFVEDSRTYALARLYDAAFDRLPDQEGIIRWRSAMEAGASQQAIADLFVASREFQGRYGGLSDRDFVQQLYRLSLDREPDAQGLETWTARLAAGTSRAEVVLLFSESIEHRQLIDGGWFGGIRYLGGPLSAETEEARPETGVDLAAADLCALIWLSPTLHEAQRHDTVAPIEWPVVIGSPTAQIHADWL